MTSDNTDLLAKIPDLLPARMLNEYAYCPRLGYMMWVESEFSDNRFTLDGKRVHEGVDEKEDELSEATEELPDEVRKSRSVMLSSETEGLIARMDMVETSGTGAVPVDYKRGTVPDIPEKAFEPERVQLCAQGLILRDNGFVCNHGVLYFAASKTRVEIPFDEPLIARTRELAREFRECASAGKRPAPLENSPKCDGCSLVGICLPDEVGFLQSDAVEAKDGLRRLVPARDDALPLYVQQHGLRVGISGKELTIKQKRETLVKARLVGTSQIGLYGNVSISAQALRACFERRIPVCHFSRGGFFYGISHGIGLRNAELKRVQFRAADDPTRCLELSKRFVDAKIANQRTLLRRNHSNPPKLVLDGLKEAKTRVAETNKLDELMGVEGYAARLYFQHFGGMVKTKESAEISFDFQTRTRRPPTDPVNAMLSFVYALLVKDCTISLMSAGFDPYLGFLHQPRFGRPALALDFMEEYRPIIGDSVVLSVINNERIEPRDFIHAAGAIAMKGKARKAVLSAYEHRMETEVTHPVFGYRIAWRRILEVQARLLGRYLCGELEEFPAMTPR